MNLYQAKKSVKDTQRRAIVATIAKEVQLGKVSPIMAQSFFESQGVSADVIQKVLGKSLSSNQRKGEL